MPGASITIVNVETNDTRVAVSNERGQYSVPFLPSGRYTVTCELQAFQSTRREGIILGGPAAGTAGGPREDR